MNCKCSQPPNENLCVKYNKNNKSNSYRFYCCFKFGWVIQQKHNAIIVHNDIGLEAITAIVKIYENPRYQDFLHCLHCLYHLSLLLSYPFPSFDATERSCFIHNNSCYCVRPPLCVYCFGLVLSVASMWRTDESLELCVCCSLCGNSLWNVCVSTAIWSFALVPF